MSAFGRFLRECRQAAGLSQRRLAERVGVDFSYISKLENGRQAPPADDTMRRLSAELGVPAAELFAAALRMPEPEAASSGQADAIRFFHAAAEMQLTPADWQHLLAVAEHRVGSREPGAAVAPDVPPGAAR